MKLWIEGLLGVTIKPFLPIESRPLYPRSFIRTVSRYKRALREDGNKVLACVYGLLKTKYPDDRGTLSSSPRIRRSRIQ